MTSTNQELESMCTNYGQAHHLPFYAVLVGLAFGFGSVIVFTLLGYPKLSNWMRDWSLVSCWVAAGTLSVGVPLMLIQFVMGLQALTVEQLDFVSRYRWTPAACKKIQAFMCRSNHAMKAWELWSVCRMQKRTEKALADARLVQLENAKKAMLTSKVHERFCQNKVCATQP